MNRLNSDSRVQVITCLIEGCSIRSTVRMTGMAKKTVMRLLVEVGEVCADYQAYVFRNLQSKRLQLDEMWSWIYCKDRNRTEEIARKNLMLATFGCGSLYVRTRNWCLRGGLDSAIWRPLQTL